MKDFEFEIKAYVLLAAFLWPIFAVSKLWWFIPASLAFFLCTSVMLRVAHWWVNLRLFNTESR
jgi:hypothetical protein